MDYRHYLPSKQFVFLLVSIILAGSIIYGASLLGKGKTLSQVVSLSTSEDTTNPNLIDGDSDGLPDWEEAVRGTDPKRADSDNDATSDGEEIKLGRNPLKTGPDDSLASAENERFIAELTAAASSTNLTDTVSRTLLAQYIGARGSGTNGDVAAQQQMIDAAIAKATVGLKGRTYTQKDVIVASDDAASMRAFANITIRTIHRHPTASFANAIGALALAIDNGDPAAIAKLKTVGQEYRLLAREFSEIPVPSKLSGQYLRSINALEHAGASFEDMAYIIEDPVRSVAGLKNYKEMVVVAGQAMLEISETIARSGVRFTADEPGLEWFAFGGEMNGLRAQAI